MNNTQKTITIAFLVLLSVSIAIATSITGQGSSFTFNISNCNANPNTPLSCAPASIRFECTVQDPAFINQVDFRIDGTSFATIENTTTPSQFYLNYNKPQELSSTTTPLTLDREQITDTNNIVVNAFENVQIPRNCSVCPSSYTPSIVQSCNVSNEKITQYTSSNETCAPSYNATEACNYCDADIITTLSTCSTNLTQDVSYSDANYNTCCLMTGLSEDCVINTPTYDNATQSCGYLQNDFNCTQDAKPVLANKINIACTLPTKEEYNCVVNVYQELNNGTNQLGSTLLSTSPEYKQTSQSIFSLSSEQETRTSFTTTQGLLNAYYTDKELRPDETFKTEVLCTNNQTTLRSQKIVIPEYHNPTGFFYRAKWIGENTGNVLGTVLVGIILFFIVVWMVSYMRRRK